MGASVTVPQKSWYNAHLTRQLYRVGKLEDWGESKDMILRFIDMQAAARRLQVQAFRALANGIEIVVDPAEATEYDLDVVRG